MIRTNKNRERRLRRMAHRKGYRLAKLRGKFQNWHGPNYRVVELRTNCTKLYSMDPSSSHVTLDDVEEFLTGKGVQP